MKNIGMEILNEKLLKKGKQYFLIRKKTKRKMQEIFEATEHKTMSINFYMHQLLTSMYTHANISRHTDTHSL
uniref:Uncharacterized protein n=1 Tax=Octopus bimaculoides TaxID=37653 RepID=A0A0L8HWD1_OCTBM